MKNAHELGVAFRLGMDYAAGRRVACDDKWITVHPSGKGLNKSGKKKAGTPVLIDEEGRVKGGMGGKFKGEKIGEIRSGFIGPKTPKASRESNPSAVRRRIKAIRDEAQEWVKKTPGASELMSRITAHFVTSEKMKPWAQEHLKAVGEDPDFVKEMKLTGLLSRTIQRVGIESISAELDAAEKRKASARKAAGTRAAKKEADRQALLERLRTMPIPESHVRFKDPLKVERSTEKAVAIKDQYGTVWLPKSQVVVDGGYVVSAAEFISNKKGLSSYTTGISVEHERNRQAYVKRQENSAGRAGGERGNDPTDWFFDDDRPAKSRAEAIKSEETSMRSKGLMRVFVPDGYAVKGARISTSPFANDFYEVEEFSKYPEQAKIDDDMPSIQGSHLLGHEGGRGRFVYVKTVKGRQ